MNTTVIDFWKECIRKFNQCIITVMVADENDIIQGYAVKEEDILSDRTLWLIMVGRYEEVVDCTISKSINDYGYTSGELIMKIISDNQIILDNLYK